MSCPFCFNAGLGVIDDMEVEEFREMVSVLSRRGVTSVDVLGGEPTLHKKIEELIGSALEARLKVTMSTNGSEILVMKRLMDTFGKACGLGVSVNGEGITGNLESFITGYKTPVKSLFHDGEKLPSMIQTIVSKGVDEYYLIYPDISPDTRDYTIPFQRFHERIGELRRSLPEISPVYCSGFLPDAETYPELLHTRCAAGVTKLGVMPDGSVYPCNLFFGVREFYLGTILSDGFDDIWSSTKLDFFRHFEKNSCHVKDCPLHARCHGGCPAQSLKWYGRIDAPDPRCCLTSS